MTSNYNWLEQHDDTSKDKVYKFIERLKKRSFTSFWALAKILSSSVL